MEGQSALSLIETNRSNLRNSEIKVANFILANAEQVIHFSVSELADSVGVSDPTIIRFCRSIGFKGFQDFKISLAQSLIPSLRNIHEAVNESEQAPELIQKVFQANIDAIRNSLNTINTAAFEQAVEILARSEQIIFFGCGGSGAVAMDAYHKFFRIGIPCLWFNDSHMAAMAAAMMSEKHALIAISHSGSSKDIVDALHLANEKKAATLAIVSQEKSPVSKIAQYVLCVDSLERYFKPEPMSSRIAQLSVIDALCVGVSLLRKKDVLANLSQTRKALINKRY
ncbi:MAG: MurR/RpiR family transcriptional regulator [Treponema sp.]|jgi:DNA-binding MurR/RpiR family transcriptional regulator|nr:MurR/RpiR family transcriptional regulator [Treponema sp.]